MSQSLVISGVEFPAPPRMKWNQLVIQAFLPNKELGYKVEAGFMVSWIAFFVFVWWQLTGTGIFPNPLEVLKAWFTLMVSGELIENLIRSFVLYVGATLISVVISLTLAFGATTTAFRPLAVIVGKSRYLALYGVSIIFVMVMEGSFGLKVSLLVFGLCGYFTASFVHVVVSVSESDLDHARSIRFSEWEVVWHVIIKGRMEAYLEIVRQNSAMGWMMLSMVEGQSMSGGGLGVMLIKQYRLLKLQNIYAVQFSIFFIAMIQDWMMKWVRLGLCRHIKHIEGR